MLARARTTIRYLIIILCAGAATWLLSWLMQFIASVTVPGPRFYIDNVPVNRLAAATTVTVLGLAVVWFLISRANDWGRFAISLLALAVLMDVYDWALTEIFPGTQVIRYQAQVIYSLIFVAWSWVLYYVFLSDVGVIVEQESDDDTDESGEADGPDAQVVGLTAVKDQPPDDNTS